MDKAGRETFTGPDGAAGRERGGGNVGGDGWAEGVDCTLKG